MHPRHNSFCTSGTRTQVGCPSGAEGYPPAYIGGRFKTVAGVQARRVALLRSYWNALGLGMGSIPGQGQPDNPTSYVGTMCVDDPYVRDDRRMRVEGEQNDPQIADGREIRLPAWDGETWEEDAPTLPPPDLWTTSVSATRWLDGFAFLYSGGVWAYRPADGWKFLAFNDPAWTAFYGLSDLDGWLAMYGQYTADHGSILFWNNFNQPNWWTGAWQTGTSPTKPNGIGPLGSTVLCMAQAELFGSTRVIAGGGFSLTNAYSNIAMLWHKASDDTYVWGAVDFDWNPEIGTGAGNNTAYQNGAIWDGAVEAVAPWVDQLGNTGIVAGGNFGWGGFNPGGGGFTDSTPLESCAVHIGQWSALGGGFPLIDYYNETEGERPTVYAVIPHWHGLLVAGTMKPIAGSSGTHQGVAFWDIDHWEYVGPTAGEYLSSHQVLCATRI